jgi:RNA polymerase sigma factor (sigma-70 family)
MRTEDGHIIFKCLEGDPAAFGLLVDKYKGSIFALAYSKLGNFHDAEDVTQEVFIKAYRKLKTLKNRDNFLAWLYAITSNLCKDWFRSRERRFSHEIVEEEIDRISMESYRDDKACESLSDALDLLPDTYRQVLMLYYLGGMNGKEIARFLGTSQNAIMLRLSRARSQLREEMITMMKTYETQRLSVSFTFRIVEIIKRITIRSTPRTPWISWSVSLTAGILFTFLSLSSPQTSFNPLKAFSELSGKIGVMDVECYPVINQQSYKASMDAEIPVEPIIVSQGLKGIALAGAGKGDESKTETPSQTNVPAVTGNVEMQTVSGKVLRDDKPVSNAQVTVYLYGTSNKYEGTTEKDGTFKIEVPKPNDNLKWDNVTVVASMSGYSFNWAVAPKNKTSDITIKLLKPAVIAGAVLDSSGKPIANAKVLMRYFSFGFGGPPTTSSISGDYIPNSSVQTDPDGKFTFNNLPEGIGVNIGIDQQGYARETKFNILAGTEGVTFKLKLECRIEGKVIYGDTGKPAKDIEIYAWGIYPTSENYSAITDDNGYYVITSLNAGHYDVLYQAKDNEWTTVGNENIKVTEGQPLKDVNFKLIKGGLITGKVTDEANEPIENFWIGAFDKSSPERRGSSAGAATNKDGNFQIRATPGNAKVYIRASQEYEPVGTLEKVVDVVEGGTVSDINFTVRKLEIFSVKGSVFTSDGEPVANAVINDAQQWYIQLAVSDKDGKFNISGLRRGQKLVVKAEQKELHLRSTAEIQVPSDEDIEIIMQEYETTSVTGRVVNKKGETIPSANIGIVRWEGNSGLGTSAGLADSSGNYKIDNLIIGDEYYVNADADGYRGSSSERFIAAKDMKPRPDIVLDTAGKYFLEGIVKDTNGNPISGARVGNNDTFSTTDENGYYKLENLFNTVEIEIGIDHSDYGYSTFRYIPTNEKHDFVLVKADGYLSGKVIDADGNPIGSATVFVDSGLPSDWESSGHVNVGANTDNNGRFQANHLLVNKRANIYVGKDRLYKIFKDVEMNRDDVVFTLKEEPAEPPKPPTAEEIEKKKYNDEIGKRSKEIIDKPSPELDVEQWIAGKPAELKGKVVVLHFWSYFRDNEEDKASLETIHFLNAIQKAYSDKGVVFVSVHAYTQKIDELKKLVKEQNPAYNIAVDKKSPIKWAKGVTFDKFGISWTQFLLIDKDGTVKYQTWDSGLERKIQELISD